MSDDLAPYAARESTSQGRKYAEKPHSYRSDFERDRDRIIHCSAFRRLEGKTQVFMPGLDDFYRTRLTHSIEVAQIGRIIARALRLNEDLTEAICLAHDLGHSPFGHAGETSLNRLMNEFGGFEHNRQSLRIVDLLEHPYPDFRGLNLTYETRLGLSRHQTIYDYPDKDTLNASNCSLEGQIASVADSIAYNCHDLEDGIKAGLVKSRQLENVRIFIEAQDRINADMITDRTIRRTRTAKAIIDVLVSDCIDASKDTIANAGIESIEEVYDCTKELITLSNENQAKLSELEKFLLQNFYQHKSLLETAEKINGWLGEVFYELCKKPELMPSYFRDFIEKEGLQRTVCDYIAGMTDRFCLVTLQKIRNEPSKEL